MNSRIDKPPLDDKGIILNAPYYSVFFTSFLLLHLYHILIIPIGTLYTKIFFCTQAIVEVFIETLLLLTISIFIKKHLPRRALSFAIGAIGIIFFIRLLDFPLIRLMDMSFWHAIDVISQERPQNLFEIALASAIPLWMYVLFFFTCLFILWLAVKTYYYLDKNSHHFPLYISFHKVYPMLCGCFLFLFIWDVGLARTFSKNLSCTDCTIYAKALPWKSAFLRQRSSSIHFPLPLRQAPSPQKIQAFLEQQVQDSSKPLVILCIAESIRSDFLGAKGTPYLEQIKKLSLPYQLALSGANATQLSWYTIFSGLTALHFEDSQDYRLYKGAPLLQKMQKEGYQIHVATASRLNFYQMDERIFGAKKKLASSFCEKTKDINAYENDRAVFASVREKLSQITDTSHFFVLFLESTHFPYSFDEKVSPFTPYTKNINIVKEACYQQNAALIANRYRNALYHLDEQIGALKSHLEAKGLWDNTLFIFTGDHGEEFFEKGNLFHASALSEQQTQVPLLIKPPSSIPLPEKSAPLLSHVDIAHSIFHLVFGYDGYTIGEGISPFSTSSTRHFALVGRYNASKAPKEVLIHTGNNRLIASFDKTNQLVIKHQEETQESILELFSPALNFIFSQE